MDQLEQMATQHAKKAASMAREFREMSGISAAKAKTKATGPFL